MPKRAIDLGHGVAKLMPLIQKPRRQSAPAPQGHRPWAEVAQDREERMNLEAIVAQGSEACRATTATSRSEVEIRCDQRRAGCVAPRPVEQPHHIDAHSGQLLMTRPPPRRQIVSDGSWLSDIVYGV